MKTPQFEQPLAATTHNIVVAREPEVATLRLCLDVPLMPAQIAQAFCELTDDGQAQVFVEIAKLAKAWPIPSSQWSWIGEHLRDCECATPGARNIIENIYLSMKEGD